MKKMSIDKLISEKILTIGADCRNYRGGVGAVLNIYSKQFDTFNFITTYKDGSALYRAYVFFIGVLKLFYTLMRNRNIKIVHIHGSAYGSFYRKFLCFTISKYLFRKKVIYHVHDGRFPLFFLQSKTLIKKTIRKFINDVDCLICLSKSWGKFYEENFNPKRIKILPNIIDYPVIKQQNNHAKKISFLYLGHITHEKGIFDVIEVIKNNIESFDHKMELIIGGIGDVAKLLSLIEKYQMGNIVKFVGWVQNETKVQYLQNADIYILASYFEGMPISVLEAMSYGKPVIATNVGGVPEIVKNNENGLLINPGNFEQLEKSIKYFIDNPQDIEKFGNISKKMVEKYLPDSVILQLENLYKDILSENN